MNQAQYKHSAEPHSFVARVSERVDVVHETDAMLDNERKIRVVVCDLSRHGVLCEISTPLDAEAKISIQLPVAGWVKAQVRWARNGRAGCQFIEPLSGALFYPTLTEMLTEQPETRPQSGSYEIPSAMLPIELLQVNRLSKLQSGSFGRSISDRTEAFFVGTSGGRPVFIRHQDDGYFYRDLGDGAVDVAAVGGVRFLADWSTAMPIEQQTTKNGALCLQRGAILICATPWNERGRHLIEVGRSDASGQSDANVSFTRWSAYIRHNGVDHPLWREGAE